MIGPLTIGRKAAKYGYKRYGVPGAIVAGLGGIGGYVFVKRKLTGSSGSDRDSNGEDGIADMEGSADGSDPGGSDDSEASSDASDGGSGDSDDGSE